MGVYYALWAKNVKQIKSKGKLYSWNLLVIFHLFVISSTWFPRILLIKRGYPVLLGAMEADGGDGDTLPDFPDEKWENK